MTQRMLPPQSVSKVYPNKMIGFLVQLDRLARQRSYQATRDESYFMRMGILFVGITIVMIDTPETALQRVIFTVCYLLACLFPFLRYALVILPLAGTLAAIVSLHQPAAGFITTIFFLIGTVVISVSPAHSFPVSAFFVALYAVQRSVSGQPISPLTLMSYLAEYLGVLALRQRRVAHRKQIELLEELQRTNAELRTAHEQLRLESQRAIELAAAEERESISREMHDILAHTLTVLVVQIGGIKRLVTRDPGRAQEQLDVIARIARDGLEEVRRTVRQIRSPAEEGLPAIQRLAEQFAQQTGVSVEIQLPAPSPTITASTSLALYRAIQEALTNAVRHGEARRIQITGHYSEQILTLTVHDDGLGAKAAPPVPGGGNGLPGIRARLEALGGSLTSGPCPAGGFTVHMEVPLRDDNIVTDATSRRVTGTETMVLEEEA